MSVEILIARYGLAAILVGAGIEGETVVVAGGLLAHREMLPFWGVAAAAVVGSFIADQLFFALGRYFRGSARVRRISEKPAFASALSALERHPTRFILIFRFLYGLRTISPIAIGTTRVHTRKFVMLNAISATVWGLVFTTVGYLFGNAVEREFGKLTSRHMMIAAIVVVVGGFCAIQGVRWVLRRRRAGKVRPARPGGDAESA
jgi:membrane protein DedA with SNARE-associated domain